MLSGVARRGLSNRLMQAGVPAGVSFVIADANYPDRNGEYDFMRDLQDVDLQATRESTRRFVQMGEGTLDSLLGTLYGPNYEEAVTFLQEMDRVANMTGHMRRED